MATIPVEKRQIAQTTLPNGLRIFTEHVPNVRSVALGFWIASGARREEAHQSGLTHFIEHMVFQGTENRTAEQIAGSLDALGGNLDAFTSKELVCFSAKVLDEHLPQAFEVLADLVLHPLFREEDIEKEKKVVLEEIKMDVDNPEHLVHELFCARFWPDHPLGRPILGTRQTVRRFTRPMVWEYFSQVYTPDNMLITAAGNLTHERLVELACRYFDSVPASGCQVEDRAPSPQAHLQLHSKKSLEQVHICLGVPTFAANHPLRYAAYILNALLGGGMSSRLFQKIREKYGLAYSVYSELNLYRDTGVLLVSAATSAASARDVVRLTLEEFRRFKEELVSEEELRRAKNYLKGSFVLGLESTSNRMASLARQYLYFGRFFEIDEILEGVEQVPAAQVQQLAQEFFQPGKLALTILGDVSSVHIDESDLVC